MTGKYVKKNKLKKVQLIKKSIDDNKTPTQLPKQYYGVKTQALGTSGADQKISEMPNPPVVETFEPNDLIPIVRNGQNMKISLSQLQGIIQSINGLITPNMQLKSGNDTTLVISNDGNGNPVFTVIGNDGTGFDPTKAIVFTAAGNQFSNPLSVADPTSNLHAVNLEYLKSGAWADGVTIIVNPNSGLICSVVCGNLMFNNITMNTNDCLIIDPYANNLNTDLTIEVETANGIFWLRGFNTCADHVFKVLSHNGTAKYTSLAAIKSDFDIGYNSSNPSNILLKALNAVTINEIVIYRLNAAGIYSHNYPTWGSVVQIPSYVSMNMIDYAPPSTMAQLQELAAKIKALEVKVQ